MRGKSKSAIIEFLKNRLKKEPVFMVSMILALFSSLFVVPSLEYVDFRVIVLLFCLMAVIAGFEESGLMKAISGMLVKRSSNMRSFAFIMVVLTAITGSLLTNDVALLSLVPLTIIVAKKSGFNPALIVILQNFAADLGSSLTPMGNPQNLYIFSYYSLSGSDFFRIMLPVSATGLIFTLFLLIFVKKEKIKLQELKETDFGKKKQVYVFFGLFILCILSVFKILDYRILFIITAVICIPFFKNLKKIDYYLLGTFFFFFIFIGNISQTDWIKNFMGNALNTQNGVFFNSVIMSQFISNVPSALLLSPFTNLYKPLLIGVNIASRGTLIGSLANLIAFRLYSREYGPKKYLVIFHILNITTLTLLIAVSTQLL